MNWFIAIFIIVSGVAWSSEDAPDYSVAEMAARSDEVVVLKLTEASFYSGVLNAGGVLATDENKILKFKFRPEYIQDIPLELMQEYLLFIKVSNKSCTLISGENSVIPIIGWPSSRSVFRDVLHGTGLSEGEMVEFEGKKWLPRSCLTESKAGCKKKNKVLEKTLNKALHSDTQSSAAFVCFASAQL